MARITKEEIKAFQNIAATNTEFDAYLEVIIPALENNVDRFTRRVINPWDSGLKEIVSNMAKFKIDELARNKNIKSESINGDYSVTYTGTEQLGSSGYPRDIERSLSKYRVLFDASTVKVKQRF